MTDTHGEVQLVLELFPVRDNADEATLALELPEGVQDKVEAVPIQAPEALIDEEEAALEAGSRANHVGEC